MWDQFADILSFLRCIFCRKSISDIILPMSLSWELVWEEVENILMYQIKLGLIRLKIYYYSTV